MKNAKLAGCNEIDVNNAVMNGAFEGPKIYRQIERNSQFQLRMHFSSPCCPGISSGHVILLQVPLCYLNLNGHCRPSGFAALY